jgi:hypothetical protein
MGLATSLQVFVSTTAAAPVADPGLLTIPVSLSSFGAYSLRWEPWGSNVGVDGVCGAWVASEAGPEDADYRLLIESQVTSTHGL